MVKLFYLPSVDIWSWWTWYFQSNKALIYYCLIVHRRNVDISTKLDFDFSALNFVRNQFPSQYRRIVVRAVFYRCTGDLNIHCVIIQIRRCVDFLNSKEYFVDAEVNHRHGVDCYFLWDLIINHEVWEPLRTWGDG